MCFSLYHPLFSSGFSTGARFCSYFATFPMNTNSMGYMKTPRRVAIDIPPNRDIPMTFRASAPAPDANTRGKTPRMKEKAVIRIGRKRSLADLTAASNRVSPFSNSSLANYTIRIAFLAAMAMSMTSDICANTFAS